MRATLLAVALCACGTTPQVAADAGPVPGCVVDFSGRTQDHVELEACGGLTATDGGFSLDLQARSDAEAATLKLHVELGASSGDFSEASVGTWSAISVDDRGCELAAGSTAIPTGTLALHLERADGGAHGTLAVTQHLQSPPGVDCGPGDAEQVDFSF